MWGDPARARRNPGRAGQHLRATSVAGGTPGFVTFIQDWARSQIDSAHPKGDYLKAEEIERLLDAEAAP